MAIPACLIPNGPTAHHYNCNIYSQRGASEGCFQIFNPYCAQDHSTFELRKALQLFCASEAIYFRSALQDLLNGIPSRHLIGPSHRDGVEVRLHFCSRFICPSDFFSVSSPSRSDQKGDLEMRRDVASITSPTRGDCRSSPAQSFPFPPREISMLHHQRQTPKGWLPRRQSKSSHLFGALSACGVEGLGSHLVSKLRSTVSVLHIKGPAQAVTAHGRLIEP